MLTTRETNRVGRTSGVTPNEGVNEVLKQVYGEVITPGRTGGVSFIVRTGRGCEIKRGLAHTGGCERYKKITKFEVVSSLYLGVTVVVADHMYKRYELFLINFFTYPFPQGNLPPSLKEFSGVPSSYRNSDRMFFTQKIFFFLPVPKVHFPYRVRFRFSAH